MDFEDFIRKLYEAGWKSPNDAQHAKIADLWGELIENGIKIPLVKKGTNV